MDETQWTIIAGIIGGLITAGVGAYLKLSGHWHKQDEDTDSRLVRDYREVVKDLRRELHDANNRNMELTEKLMACQERAARAFERVAAREDVLRRHKIQFTPWPEDSSYSMDVLDSPPDLES